MVNLTTNKIIAVAGGIFGVGATGAGIIYLTSGNAKPQKNIQNSVIRKKIVDLLGDNGREMLDISGNKDEQTWKTNWEKFKQKYSVQNINGSLWAFEGRDGKISGDEVTKNFKDKCKANSESIVNNIEATIYQEVSDYCTKAKVG